MTETVYPLIFTYGDTVAGNGFLAGVIVTGTALITKEEDGKWWMYGVRPAALADRGQTPPECFSAFRERYKTVLFDIAEESDSFESFRAKVEQFFYEPDEQEERRWADAYLLIRSGQVVLEEPFSQLKKDSPESRPTSISVARLDKTNRFMATDNTLDTDVIPEVQAA